MSQGLLFGEATRPPLARKTDPETSHDAAEAIRDTLTKKHQHMMAAAAALGPSTAYELARWCRDRYRLSDIEEGSHRKRTHELKDAGKLRVVGRKVCNVTNGKCQILEATT